MDVASLRDPQPDEDRVQKPEWLVMLGMFGVYLFYTPPHVSRGPGWSNAVVT